jgi:hypothetical protein
MINRAMRRYLFVSGIAFTAFVGYFLYWSASKRDEVNATEFDSVMHFAGLQRYDSWHRGQRDLGESLANEIESANEVEIFAIDPDRGGGAQGAVGVLPTGQLLGRRNILGRSNVSESDDRRFLGEAIRDGLRDAPEVVAKCWEPRHALRFRKGTLDKYVVICFRCGHGFAEEDGKTNWFNISSREESTWQNIFAIHGLIQ